MKKVLSIVLICVMLMSFAVPAFAADTLTASTIKSQYQVINYSDGRTDILAGKAAKFSSPSTNSTSLGAVYYHTEDNCLTDGIVCVNGFIGRTETGEDAAKFAFVYMNKAWNGNNANTKKANDDIANYTSKTYEFPGVTGVKYLTNIEIADLKADAEGFALYITNDVGSDNVAKSASTWHGDPEFDILVSTDGGKTYEVAWSSVTFEKNETAVTKHAWYTKDKGGNATLVETKDGETVKTSYLVIKENFAKTYKDVTNVVYAAKKVRVGSASPFEPFYYGPRYSEFDVFAPAEKKTPATGDTSMIVVMMLAGAVALTSTVVVIRKRREEI